MGFCPGRPRIGGGRFDARNPERTPSVPASGTLSVTLTSDTGSFDAFLFLFDENLDNLVSLNDDIFFDPEDPNNPNSADDGYGGNNSVVNVP